MSAEPEGVLALERTLHFLIHIKNIMITIMLTRSPRTQCRTVSAAWVLMRC